MVVIAYDAYRHCIYAASMHYHASKKIAHHPVSSASRPTVLSADQLPTGSFDDPYPYCGSRIGDNGVCVERTKVLYEMVAFLGRGSFSFVR